MELRNGELFFLHVIREFDFLIKLGYIGAEYSFIGRGSYVKFRHHGKSKTVYIGLEENGHLCVTINQLPRFGSEKMILRKYMRWSFDYSPIQRLALLIQTDFPESFN